MNKERFLSELKRELNEKGVQGVDEILAEYEEHFSYKLEEGWTEEEIAKKLSSPSEIAEEYSESGKTENPSQRDKVLMYSALLR